jgi:ribonuclease T1
VRLFAGFLAFLFAFGAAGFSERQVEKKQLPREAHETIALIRTGGPFPHRQDGATFGNRERLLPARERGWYREYTVKTPGARDRGARRIVAGQDGTLYYTDDHYRSFKRILE